MDELCEYLEFTVFTNFYLTLIFTFQNNPSLFIDAWSQCTFILKQVNGVNTPPWVTYWLLGLIQNVNCYCMVFGPLSIILCNSYSVLCVMTMDTFDYKSLLQSYNHFNSPHNFGVPQTNLRKQALLFDHPLVIVNMLLYPYWKLNHSN